MAQDVDSSASAIAEWMKGEFPEGAIEFRHVDEDYQLQPRGVSAWQPDELKDRFLYRVTAGTAKYELEVTVIALEDHPIEQILEQIRNRRVAEALRSNPGQRLVMDRALNLSVRR